MAVLLHAYTKRLYIIAINPSNKCSYTDHSTITLDVVDTHTGCHVLTNTKQEANYSLYEKAI